MQKKMNPFSEAIAGQYFVGRESQLKQFEYQLEGLRLKTPNHFFIAGVHGTGKTSFLEKIGETAESHQFARAKTVLDAEKTVRDHILTIMCAIVTAVNANIKRVSSDSATLVSDWDRGANSQLFRSLKGDKIETDLVRHDLESLENLVEQFNIPGVIICIDEGQRIAAGALSILKNAIQPLKYFLLALSLRIVSDVGGAEKAGRQILEDKAREAEGDFGASRLFVTGISLGPFVTDTEAVMCIEKRLENNEMQFEEDIVKSIYKISKKIPRDIISLSSQVYNDALAAGVNVVDTPFFQAFFRKIYANEYNEVKSIYESSSRNAIKALLGLARFDQPVEAKRIAEYVYTSLPDEAMSHISEAIKHDLQRLCRDSTFCLVKDDIFEIVDYKFKYAIDIVASEHGL